MLSILYGLGSAVSWGAADFTGGLASRRTGAYRAVLYGELAGLFFISIAAAIAGQPVPPWPVLLLAAAAGAIGTTGLLTLFRAVIHGKMSIAMPVSALLAAALPVLVGAITEGLPGVYTLAGFCLALLSIWLISREHPNDGHILSGLADLKLPLLAGVGFGGYFILMRAATREATLWPMMASRGGGTLIIALFMIVRQESWQVARTIWAIILLNSILDVSGTGFFVLASQAGRLDVAAVLSSLYPASTVLLASIFLKERIQGQQLAGILMALAAIGLLAI